MTILQLSIYLLLLLTISANAGLDEVKRVINRPDGVVCSICNEDIESCGCTCRICAKKLRGVFKISNMITPVHCRNNHCICHFEAINHCLTCKKEKTQCRSDFSKKRKRNRVHIDMGISNSTLTTPKERDAVFSPIAAIPTGFHSGYHGCDASDYLAPDLQPTPRKRQKQAYLDETLSEETLSEETLSEETMSEETCPDILYSHISDLEVEIEGVELISSHILCAILHDLQGVSPYKIESDLSIKAEKSNKICLDSLSGRAALVTAFIQGQWQTAILVKEGDQRPAALFYIKERKSYVKLLNAETTCIHFTNINVFMFHLQSNSYITESSQERALDAIMLWDVN